MKYLVFAALATVAFAAEQPFIVGTIENQDHAKITFTSYNGTCAEKRRVVYAQHNGGKIGVMGCWSISQSQIFVIWSDGDIYTYPLNALEISPEMSAYLKNKTQYQ